MSSMTLICFLTRNVRRASGQRSNTIIFSRVTFSEVNCMP